MNSFIGLCALGLLLLSTGVRAQTAVSSSVLIDQKTGQIHRLDVAPDLKAKFSYRLFGLETYIDCAGQFEPLTKKYGSGLAGVFVCGADQENTAIEILIKKSEAKFYKEGGLATARLTIVNDGFPVFHKELDMKKY